MDPILTRPRPGKAASPRAVDAEPDHHRHSTSKKRSVQFKKLAASPFHSPVSFADITGVVTAPATLPPAGKTKLPLTLQNLGNIAAKGTLNATIYASTDSTFDTGDRQLAGPLTLKTSLKASGSKAGKLTILTPADLPAGSYFLIAILDATSFTETATANNTIVSATTSSIG